MSVLEELAAELGVVVGELRRVLLDLLRPSSEIAHAVVRELGRLGVPGEQPGDVLGDAPVVPVDDTEQ